MRLVAVVLSWNGREDTLRALESLRGVETVLVDNGSTDGSPEAVEERFPEVEVIRTGANLGFAGGNNVGIRRALDNGAGWVLLLNNDAWIDPGLPAALERAARARPGAGVLACKVFLAEPPDRLWYAGMRLSKTLGLHRHVGFGKPDAGFDALREVVSATGAAMAVSRAALETAGLLDEGLFAYAEDLEWCLRIRRSGFEIVFVPDARTWHRVSASTGGASSPTGLYYDTRNTIGVAAPHLPLPRPLRSIRRGAIVAAHVAQRPRAARHVLRGWRDVRRGRMGRR